MMKLRNVISFLLVITLLVSCSSSPDNNAPVVVDGKNLSEVTVEEGKVYTVMLSKGSSFTVGGDGESLYSFCVVDNDRGIRGDLQDEKRDDLLDGGSVFIAYGSDSKEGSFSSEDLTSSDQDLVLQVCRLNGDLEISYNEVKNARRHGQTVISEAFFATPEKLIQKGIIDGYEVCLSQTSMFDSSDPDYDGHSGYSGRCYGLVLDGVIHSGEEFQGVIDLKDYAGKKIGFFNSVTNIEGGGVSMHLNISSPVELDTVDEKVDLKKSASVFKISPPDKTQEYALEINVRNLFDVCDLYTPVICARDVEKGTNLSTVIAPSNVLFGEGNSAVLYVYLGELSEDILCNFSLIGESRMADAQGVYADVTLVEYNPSKHGVVYKISSDGSSLLIDGEAAESNGNEFTIPNSNGMISFIYDMPDNKAFTAEVVSVTPETNNMGTNITRISVGGVGGGNTEASGTPKQESGGCKAGYLYYAVYGKTQQTSDIKIKIKFSLD